jgi:hypothetical protein
MSPDVLGHTVFISSYGISLGFERDVLGHLIAFFSYEKTSTDVSGCLWISQDMLFSLSTQHLELSMEC